MFDIQIEIDIDANPINYLFDLHLLLLADSNSLDSFSIELVPTRSPDTMSLFQSAAPEWLHLARRTRPRCASS